MTDLLTLEHAWSRLATHLEWADRFWVVFVFTDDPRVVEALRRRAKEQLEGTDQGFVALRPSAPAEIEDVIAKLLGDPPTSVSFVDLVRHDPAGAQAWRQAWERLMLRLNERRELLRRRAPTGGIVFATTLDRLDETPALAPDLWTIRALLLRVAPQQAQVEVALAPEPWQHARATGERRDPVLARQAVEQARTRGDERGLLEALVVLAGAVEGEESLKVAREARELAERLLAGGEAARSQDIAAALRRLGDVLVRGQYDAEAEGCYRRSIELGCEPEVAASLLGLGDVYSNMAEYSRSRALGLREQALEVTQEAVEHYRELARDQREVFLPQLARSLYELGRRLGELRRLDDARNTTQEAVEIYRGLNGEGDGAQASELASTIANLGAFLTMSGRFEEGVRALQEAIDVWRQVEDASPDIRSKLALSLTNLAGVLRERGRLDEALQAAQDAVELWQRLRQENSNAHLPFHAARSLNEVGATLLALGREEDALAVLRETIVDYREVALDHRAKSVIGLARGLMDLCACLTRSDRWDSALPVAREAVELCRELAHSEPQTYLAALADSLVLLGICLTHANGEDEALPTKREAVEIYRDLGSPHLAIALSNLADSQSKLGRCEEALGSASQAVEILRELSGRHPHAFDPELAHALARLGQIDRDLGQRMRASGRFAKGLRVILPRFLENPTAHRRTTLKLAELLQNLDNKYGVSTPEDLAPAVAHLLDLDKPGPPSWTPAPIVEQPATQAATPDEPQQLAQDSHEPAWVYILRASILILIFILVLVLASIFA